jgi:AAA family ATP:ADP antiporter
MLRLLGRVVDVKREELPALGWTWLYFYAVLASYYVIRPIATRPAWPAAWTTCRGCGRHAHRRLAVEPGLCRARRPLPARQIRLVVLPVFCAEFDHVLLRADGSSGAENIWLGRVFYVWTAVFNLFVPSVFWAFMTDIFTREQAKRLFGIISAAGTLGAMTGSILTATLAEHIPPIYLLFCSAALIELAVLAVRRLSTLTESLRQVRAVASNEQIIGGSVIAGIRNALKSPYLLGISSYMLMFTILSTVLYFQQAGIVDRTFSDRGARTVFFARVDLLTNALAFVLQIFAFGNLVKFIGVTLTLAVLPAVSAAGFGLLGIYPTVAAVVVFQAVRRAGNFAVARPTREVLFTVLPREDRYKTKNFIDTFVYRLGDQIGAWSQAALGAAGMGLVGMAWLACRCRSSGSSTGCGWDAGRRSWPPPCRRCRCRRRDRARRICSRAAVGVHLRRLPGRVRRPAAT